MKVVVYVLRFFPSFRQKRSQCTFYVTVYAKYSKSSRCLKQCTAWHFPFTNNRKRDTFVEKNVHSENLKKTGKEPKFGIYYYIAWQGKKRLFRQWETRGKNIERAIEINMEMVAWNPNQPNTYWCSIKIGIKHSREIEIIVQIEQKTRWTTETRA